MNDKMKEEVLDSWNSWKYDIKDMTGTFLYLKNEEIDKRFKLAGLDHRAVIFRKYNENGQAILDIPLYNTAIEYTVKNTA